jgi:hypothetical protein
VIWTASSVESRWVLGEADTAASAAKLVPVRHDSLPESQLPIGFRALHTIPLRDREGVLRALRNRLATAPIPLSRWATLKRRLSRRISGSLQRVTAGKIAVFAALLGIAGYFLLALTDWLAIRDSMEPSEFEHHLATFPFSPFAGSARAKLSGMDEWPNVLRSRSIQELQQFADKYPNSLYRPFVLLRLQRLQALASARYKPVLLPDSSNRLLDAQDIERLNCDRLWTARNEIYFAVGYCFSSDSAINFFHQNSVECHYNNCKVFKKFNALAQDVISNTENENISRLRRREREVGCRVPEQVRGICSE